MDTAVIAVGVAAGWVGVGDDGGVVVVGAPMAQAARRTPGRSIKGALQRRDLRNMRFSFRQTERDARGLVGIFQIISLHRVDRPKLHMLTFKLDGHSHLEL